MLCFYLNRDIIQFQKYTNSLMQVFLYYKWNGEDGSCDNLNVYYKQKSNCYTEFYRECSLTKLALFILAEFNTNFTILCFDFKKKIKLKHIENLNNLL